MREYRCELCHNLVNLSDSSPIEVIPRAYVHSSCRQSTGKSTYEIGESIQCCQSREFVSSLGGSVAEKNHSIPLDQFWVYDRANKVLTKFKLSSTGRVLSLITVGLDEKVAEGGDS